MIGLKRNDKQMNLVQLVRRSSLRYQVLLGVALIFLFFFGVASYVALRAIKESTRFVSEARLHLATTTAKSLDNILSQSAAQLQSVALLHFSEATVQRWRQQAEVLYYQHGLEDIYEYLVLAWFEDQIRIEVVPPLDYLEKALSQSEWAELTGETGKISMGELYIAEVWSQPRLLLKAPMEDGKPRQVIMGVMRTSYLQTFLPEGEALVARIINDKGEVLADKAGRVVQEEEEHMALLKPLIEEKKPGAVIHKGGPGEHGHIVVYSPLSGLNAGILLEEPRDIALAIPTRLTMTILWLGIVGLALLISAASLHSQGVIRPVIKLAEATKNITRGVFEPPLPSGGLGEVGLLAENLEVMRLVLKRAQEERLGWEKELERQVRQRTQQVHQLMSQIISIQEEERRRLAWELHDETAQMLATTLVTLRAAQQAPDQGRAQELIGRALAQQVQALVDIRRIIYALRPAALDDLGLASALRAYTEDRLVAKGISIQFEVMGEDKLLTKPVQTAVFRILQEAVNNIAKHAEAQKVSFRLKFHHEKLEVTVEDDGKGFDFEKALSRDQVGIQGMKERAEIIGAQLVLKSTPGSGTIVCLTVPLYPEEGEGG